MNLDKWGQNQTIDNVDRPSLLEIFEGSQASIILICGPNGVGKSSIIDGLIELGKGYTRIVRTTSKDLTTEETNYRHLDQSNFQEAIQQNRFLEWSKYGQGYYGTRIEDIQSALENGTRLILDVDADAAMLLKKVFTEIGVNVYDFFVSPISLTELEQQGSEAAVNVLRERLVKRNRETSATEIEGRLRNARAMLEQYSNFSYYLANTEGALGSIVRAVQGITNSDTVEP